jgi:transketolase
MRKTFSDYMEKIVTKNPDLIFITGDLGFNAFENLKQKMGNRFINAGVAEQSMVSIAAGIASQGHRVFVYSIAPFIVYRALEQIRNDVCFHQLPVYFIGNGGGYGYGIMGSSHHALSDIAVMKSLPNMTCYVPAFKEDISLMIDKMLEVKNPTYLRLGLGKSKEFKSESLEDFVQLISNQNSEVTLVSSGPVITNIIEFQYFNQIKNKLDIFIVNKFPIEKLSSELEISLRKTKKIIIIEEHVSEGGLGSEMATIILNKSIKIDKWISRFAINYPDNRYGDQQYHLKKSKLDGASIFEDIINLLNS